MSVCIRRYAAPFIPQMSPTKTFNPCPIIFIQRLFISFQNIVAYNFIRLSKEVQSVRTLTAERLLTEARVTRSPPGPAPRRSVLVKSFRNMTHDCNPFVLFFYTAPLLGSPVTSTLSLFTFYLFKRLSEFLYFLSSMLVLIAGFSFVA